MPVPARKRIQTDLIVAGIIIFILGMSIHLWVPNDIHPSMILFPEAGETIVENIHFHRGPVTYLFRLDVRVWSQGVENCSIFVLNATEYERYLIGTPVEDLNPIFYVTNRSSYLLESELSTDLDVYLIFVNNNSFEMLWVYFYAIIPSTFFPSLILAFTGLFLVLGTLCWRFTGHKRYFIVGLVINLTLFFLRIFTLVNMTLGTPWVVDYFLEPYNDYNLFYVAWVRELWNGVWPYSESFSGYIYPPFFIYTIAALGSSTTWLPGVPLFSFNIATGYLVYLIADNLTGDERRSTVAMLTYFLNPLTLVYGSFLWLNPTPYVFFVLLSLYLVLTKQGHLAIVTLAVATLYKQFTVVFFPLLVIVLIKTEREGGLRNTVTRLVKYTLIYVLVLLIVSLPFLLVDYEKYLARTIFLSMGQRIEYLATFHPQPSYPVNFNTFFLWIGAPPFITIPIAYLLSYYVLFGVPTVLVFFVYARAMIGKGETRDTRRRGLVIHALFWSIIIVMLLQLFYPRGAYKFYLLALTPFIAILFDYKDLTLSSSKPFEVKKRHFFPVLMSLVVWLCFRFIYFWILIVWTLFYLWKRGYWSALHNSMREVLSC